MIGVTLSEIYTYTDLVLRFESSSRAWADAFLWPGIVTRACSAFTDVLRRTAPGNGMLSRTLFAAEYAARAWGIKGADCVVLGHRGARRRDDRRGEVARREVPGELRGSIGQRAAGA